MTERERIGPAEVLIYVALGIAFIDESVRKSVSGSPVLVTGAKDLLLLLAGFVIIVQPGSVPRRYWKYFAGWVLVTLFSGLWVFGQYRSLMLLGATVRTYTLAPLLFAVGYYLGHHDAARRRAARIFLIGGLLAIGVAIAQESARDSLPEFLSTRIYRARHGSAGGEYNESLFASPQTFGQVAVLLGAWSFAALILPSFSRHRIAAAGVLLASLGGVYLSRIRTALLAHLCVLFLIWLCVWKVGTRRDELPGPLRGILAGILIVCVATSFYYLVLPEISDSSPANPTGDTHYYQMLFDTDLLTYRLSFFLLEFARAGEHDWFFGYGAGTGGRTREFVETDFRGIPEVGDTGLYLLYHEMGMLGLAAFLACYGGLTVQCAIRMTVRPSIPVVSIPAFAIGTVFLLWFLLKSHTCIANGLSHIIWLGSIGICCAVLDGVRRERSSPLADVVSTPMREDADAGDRGRP